MPNILIGIGTVQLLMYFLVLFVCSEKAESIRSAVKISDSRVFRIVGCIMCLTDESWHEKAIKKSA